MTINTDRVALLDTITLHEGGHSDFTEGHCAMEVVAWLAEEGHTDAPSCASPVLRRYTIRLNDRWDDDQRQALKPYLPRMVGTGDDGLDDLRLQVATAACAELVGPWLRLAGLDEHAAALAQVATDRAAIRRALQEAHEAAREVRTSSGLAT